MEGGGGLHDRQFSLTKRDLGMACHTPPLKKVKRYKGKCHYLAQVLPYSYIPFPTFL